jgi:hypothetical protein
VAGVGPWRRMLQASHAGRPRRVRTDSRSGLQPGTGRHLTGVGLLFLYAGRFLERRALSGRWSGILQYAPALAAVAVTASGAMIVARALLEIRGICARSSRGSVSGDSGPSNSCHPID